MIHYQSESFDGRRGGCSALFAVDEFNECDKRLSWRPILVVFGLSVSLLRDGVHGAGCIFAAFDFMF